MKLILKRVGDDPRLMTPMLSSRRTRKSDEQSPDTRPFALHTEDGQFLPCQTSTSMTSNGDGLVTVTVVFEVDGVRVLVEGDK